MVHIPTTQRKFYDNSVETNSLSSTAGALLPAAQQAQKIYAQQQDIRIDTNTTKARLELDNLKNQWRMANQANPDNAEAKLQLQNEMKSILNGYGDSIDPTAKMKWNIAANKIMSAYELANNQWALDQRSVNAKLDVAENINLNYDKAYSFGQSGNFADAVAELNISHGQLENYGNSALGATETRKLLLDYKKGYLEHFITGQMMTDPEGAIAVLEDEQIKKFLSDEEANNLKVFALSKLDTAKTMRLYNNIAQDIKNGVKLLNNSVNGGLSLEQINASMPQRASADYKSLIYSMNGFNKKASGKLTDEDKSQYLLNVYGMVSELLANKDATPEDFEAMQNVLYEGMSVGAVNKSEGLDVLNKIYTPLQESWAKRIAPYSDSNWFVADHGAELVKTFIEKNHITKPVGKKGSKDRMRTDVANKKAMVDGYRVYYGYLQEAATAKGYSNIADILTENNIVKRNEILDEAAEKTIVNFNKKRFEKLKNLKPEDQPNAVLSNGDMVSNSNNLDNSKQGTPVKTQIAKVGTKNGKFFAQTSDGKTIEITENQYNQYKGL